MRTSALAVLAMLAAGCAHHTRLGTTVPALVAPRDQAVLTNHPRTIRFEWSRVPKAASYSIEIDCYGCCTRDRWCSETPDKSHIVPHIAAIAYTYTFPGDHRGRWRVWAVNAKARPGAKSPWREFSFQAAPAQSSPPDGKKPSPFGAPKR